MSYPKPTAPMNSAQGVVNAGAWHNYLLETLLWSIGDPTMPTTSPVQGKKIADAMLASEVINSTEHAYLYQYFDAYAVYYNESTKSWTRGFTHLPGEFANSINAIHDSAAISPNATGDIFKAISNIHVDPLSIGTMAGYGPHRTQWQFQLQVLLLQI